MPVEVWAVRDIIDPIPLLTSARGPLFRWEPHLTHGAQLAVAVLIEVSRHDGNKPWVRSGTVFADSLEVGVSAA